jgi:hypothetical protein
MLRASQSKREAFFELPRKMFSVFAVLFFLAFSLFTPESIIPVIVGGAASLGLTQFLKNQTGAMGVLAMLLAVLVSFVVAIVAFVITSLMSGTPFSWEMIPAAAAQIFALATIAFKLLAADTTTQSRA